MRGGEKVLEAILELFPNSEIFTLFHFPGTVSNAIERREIHTSELQHWAESATDYRKLLPFFTKAVGKWTFEDFDLVVSSSHCVAKGVDTKEVPHLCYCHTPMRYIWDRFDDYFPRRQPLRRAVMSVLAPRLRRWDVRTAASVDRFVANSSFVRERIAEYYSRDADVVHPFLDSRFFQRSLVDDRDDYDLVVSALVPYKRLDLAVDAARSRDRKLVIVGDGPLRRELETRGQGIVEMRGWLPFAELFGLYARARSLVMPGVEDFGITPLEAMAVGTPVVSIGRGGVCDTVVDGRTGIFFEEQSVSALTEALKRAGDQRWDRQAIRDRAAEFSKEHFLSGLHASVETLLRDVRTPGAVS